MNISAARKLHERRFRASPVMTTGELLNLIGSDAMQEALNQRWLVPDLDTGFLTLNLHGAKMRELECACVCSSCGGTQCDHAPETEKKLSYAMPMRETFAAFGVTRPGGATSSAPPVMPRPPAPPTGTVNPEQDRPKIGDDVMVAEENKTFTGKVASIAQDGRMRISFGSEKPRMDRDYGFGEVRVVEKSKPNA